MRAIVIEKGDKKNTAVLKEMASPALSEDGVRVEVAYSSMNYKDALVLGGIPGIVQTFPMVAGIDFAGRVVESHSTHFAKGDLVVATGWGLCERYWGGYAEEVCVPAHFLCRLPAGRDARWAMQLATAGLTAMMAVMCLERNNAMDIDAPVVVTGAGGGVGSVALIILAALKRKVCALSGRPQLGDYLRALGADDVIGRDEASNARQPLDTPRWSGVIDNVGGTILAGLLSQLHYGGVAALCGLASSPQYAASVMPYILRSISVCGIESVRCPSAQRVEIWERLDKLVDDAKLDSTTCEEISLEQTLEYAPRLLAGEIRGRLLVKPN